MSRWNPVIGCQADGCDRPHKTRGYCGPHAERIRRGVPIGGSIKPYRVTFDDSYEVVASGCWEWRGPLSTGGYGRLSKEYAHRVSYEQSVGPIPDGYQIDHLCRNRACVNPEHLEAVTPQENILRGMSPSALRVRSGVCPKGHEMTEANTYRRSNRSGRECRICTLADQRERRQESAS